MAVSMTGTVGLRQAANYLARLGSLFVTHLPPSALWTWVFVKGGRTISETAILQDNATHHAHVVLPLSCMPGPDISDSRRWQYCAAHGVMGGLCDEVSPDALPPPTPPPVTYQTALARVPVVVTAGNRHQYLYHSLTTLLRAPGAEHNNVEVVLGDATPSTTQLLQLMNVTFTTLTLRGQGNNRLFWYYRDVFRLVANKFPDAPAVIFLDEDIEVSPDFFSFMSQTLWLLDADPTLYCVNGHSAMGLQGLAFDSTRVFRGAVQVEWGYGVTLDFVREALALWEDVSTHNTAFYDFWLYMNVRKGRECVFPEITRTLHFGMGVNTDPYRKEKGPMSMVLVREAPIALRNVARLRLTTWRHDLSRNISAAIPLRGNPCRATFLPDTPTSPHYVFYYKLDMLRDGTGRPDPYQYFQPTECLGMWSLSEQGHHQGIAIVRFAESATLYLVGVPYSHYSHLRPSTVPLWDADALTDQEFEQMSNYTQARDAGTSIIANVNVTSRILMKELSTV
ncbi:protein O-linked-mannose beta-1,2-N-acetylglucosaminyltransferase 1-like [Panulirus ornatus]|uniref:protein O-linked-mannose beta-1,2-N-acetylglucosaminyltransferase 1-like n=1 Tax=Panulirus ornatus TaxID=150431 RepID=UPI003A841982